MHVDEMMTFPMRMTTTTKIISGDDFENDVTIHN